MKPILESLKKIATHQSFVKLVVLAIFCVTILKNIPSHNKDLNSALNFIPIAMRLKPINFSPTIKVSGITKTINNAIIRTKSRGVIKQINVKHGRKVNKGTVLITLEKAELENALIAAQSNYEHKIAEFKAAQKLSQKKFYSENSLLAAKADMEKAKADLQKATNDADDLQIKADEDGYLEECFVNKGNTVFAQDKLISFVYERPAQIRAYVSEENVSLLKQGMLAKINTNNQVFTAKITGISQVANLETRNFYVELDLDEKTDLSIFGTTVQVEIFLEPRTGFWINASALTLNDEGELGVKIIENNNKINFMPVHFWQLMKDGTYIETNTHALNVITYGGEFLKTGETITNIHYQEIPIL